MNILVTSSRMPFAVEEIRKLGEEGHTVFAADTYALAPGNHSRYAAQHFEIPSPRRRTREFIARVASICRQEAIDWVLPTFEEAIYLSRWRQELPSGTKLFSAPWHRLLELHDKSSFLGLAKRLSLSVPPTHVVKSHDQMRARMEQFGDYFSRPVISRGATQLLSSRPIERGKARLEDCEVSPKKPWVIQPFVEGPEVCSYSIARRGRLVAHVTYRHPFTLGDRGGIAFESIDSAATLPAARALARATEYTGQFGLDYIESKDGLVLSECNPRATSGVALLPSEVFERCVCSQHHPKLFVAKPGIRRQIKSGLLFDTLQHPTHLPKNAQAYFSFGDDVYSGDGDVVPGLVSLLSFSHARKYQKEMPQEATYGLSDVVASQFYDISWQRD